MPARKIDTLLDIWAASLIGLGKEQGGEPAPWMSNAYKVWYQDPCEVIHGILEYDASNDQRHWQDFMLGDWAWEQVDRILSDDPTVAGATLVPIILGSDKTTVLVATGQTDYYPLYLSTGNVHNTLHSTREHASTQVFHKFKRQLFHSSLTHILYSLRHPMKEPETILFGDNYYRRVIYALTAYIADYEEQCCHDSAKLDFGSAFAGLVNGLTLGWHDFT
ncbi:hypothetical protein F5141DRAFT_1062017 [Pisolithus sp. B1]|nr:hypothetical protein F5141DRAFT_1062017 [Pisolithus sp. B1]